MAPTGFHLRLADSAQCANAEISHNLFYQPGGDARIDWNGDDYNVADLQAATGKCQGCLETNPLFVDTANDDFHIQFDSPARDAATGSALYQQFEFFFGQSIRFDFEGTPRPQGKAWDIGAYEVVPSLALHGIPANGTIYLNWEVNATLPPTTTWTLTYEGTPGEPPSPITGIPEPSRAFTVTGVTNYEPYTVTLSTVGATPILSDTVWVMPTDHLLYLPLVLE